MILMLTFVGSLVASTLYQSYTHQDVSVLRLVDSHQPPELSLDSKRKWHLFLSHVWLSGQDQVGNIKNVLIRMMPGCKIFLDVDDLEEIGELANYVEASQSMLIFLSKGYFSNNCLEELDSAMCAMVPLILVHETDASRGAAPLDVLRSECPRPLFDDRKEIIPWHRMAEFQLFSLKKIAEHMLHATPLYINSPKPTLYVPGELTTQPLTFRRQAKVHLSSHNPGVQDIINELDARYGLRSLDIKTFTSDTSCARAFAQSPPASVPKTLRREFFLLHLKRDTFVGPEGVALAEDVRALRAQGVELVLTHENDVDRGGCPFSRLFEITPDDLIKTGLYKKIAIPFHAYPCRAVSIALLAKALGAGTSGRAWFFEKNSGDARVSLRLAGRSKSLQVAQRSKSLQVAERSKSLQLAESSKSSTSGSPFRPGIAPASRLDSTCVGRVDSKSSSFE